MKLRHYCAAVQQPERDAIALLEQAVQTSVPAAQQAEVKELILDELRRLHEGVLARYGLRSSEWMVWLEGRQR